MIYDNTIVDNCINLPHYCAWLQSVHWFTTLYVVVCFVFNCLRRDVIVFWLILVELLTTPVSYIIYNYKLWWSQYVLVSTPWKYIHNNIIQNKMMRNYDKKTVIHTYQTVIHITKNHRGVLHNEPLGNGPGRIFLYKRYQTAKYIKWIKFQNHN